MPNPKHFARLRDGVEAWNAWRVAQPWVRPDLRAAELSRANLNKADLSDANLNKADLSRADLSDANLNWASLIAANLSRANLKGAALFSANLSRADLNGASLIAANLSRANLKGAVLFSANLSRANLSRAVLRGADFGWADLSRADVSEAVLCEADLREADLRQADLTETDLSRTDLRGAVLSRATLVETNLESADLTNCSIYGISAWKLNLKDSKQANLVITPYGERAITVDSLEVAQFIYLLLRHERLRDVLKAVTQRGVLLLGRFADGGLELLQAVAEKLRDLQYLPMICDFERPEGKDYTETVKTLVGLSRFVIVELSSPSVPQELYATVPHFDIPFVPIIQRGMREYAMFVDLRKYPWVLPPVEFADQQELLELMPTQIIDPAEERAKERQERLDELFGRSRRSENK